MKIKKIFPGAFRTPLSALFIGLALTFIAIIFARDFQQKSINIIFSNDADQFVRRFKVDLNQNLENLLSLKSFYETTGEHTSEKLIRLSQYALNNSHGLRDLCWTPLTLSSEIKSLCLSSIQPPDNVQHTPDFLSTQLVDRFLTQKNPNTPFLKLQPRASDESVESPMLIDVFIPLYSDQPPPNLIGMITGTFDGHSLMEHSFNHINNQGLGLQLQLYSTSPSYKLIWQPSKSYNNDQRRYVPPPFLLKSDKMVYTRPFHLSDQTYELRLTPVDYRLFIPHTLIFHWVILALGIVGSLALFLVLLIHGLHCAKKGAARSERKEHHPRPNDEDTTVNNSNKGASEGLVSIDNKGKISFVSQNLALLGSYETHELIGQPIDRFLTHAGRKLVREELAKHQQGVIENFELDIYRKDGTWIVFSVTMSPFFDEEGHYDGALITLHCLTDQHHNTEKNLVINEAKFRAITEHGGDITLICDLDNLLTYISPSVENMLNLSISTLMEKPITDLLHLDDRTIINERINTVQITPKQRTTLPDFRLIDSEGKAWFFNGYAIGLMNDSTLEGVVINGHNINNKKNLDRLTFNHNKTLEKLSEGFPLNKAIEDFLLQIEAFLPNTKVSLHVYNAAQQKFDRTIAPGFGDLFIQTMNDLPLETNQSPATTAAYYKKRYVCDDLALHAFNPRVNTLFATFSLRACWAEPLFSASGKLIGVLSVMSSIPGAPDFNQIEILRSSGLLAGIAIERHLSEEALRDSEIKWRALIAHMPDNVALLSLDGTVLFANRVAEAYNMEEVVGTQLVNYIAPKYRKPFQETLDRALATGKTQTLEIPLSTPKGVIWWSNRVGLMRRAGEVTGFIAIGSDVTERKKFELSLQILSSAVEQSGSAIFITNLKGQIEYINPRFTEVFGYTLEELRGQTPSIWRSDETQPSVHRDLWKTIIDEKTWYGEIRNQRKNGELFWALETISPVVTKEGKFTHIIAVCEDLTQIKATEEAMERLTYYDSLTGLENRRLFSEHLEQALIENADYPETLALFYLDLDQFKRINDTLGYDAGDQLLKSVSHKLRSSVKAEDVVARFGGDEFALILRDIKGAADAGSIARRIMESLAEPIKLMKQDIIVTASIGITLAPIDSSVPDILMRNADLAMYRAKDSGRNNYQFFTEEMNTEARGRLELENELRTAIEQEQFVLFYQPILDFNTSEMHGVEVLIRWLHPEKGIVAPDQFVPMLEETGMVITLGKWILQEACRCARAIELGYTNNLVFSVNLSARQFDDPELVSSVETALKESGLSPSLLDLEITETVLMENLDDGVLILDQLKSLGVSLTIDDFGTGYSSLAYLKKMPIDKVKVDRAFVKDIPHNVNDMEITAAVIAMAHKLNLVVTAEGIETGEQLLFLRKNNCDYGQGYLYSRPLDWDVLLTQLDLPVPS